MKIQFILRGLHPHYIYSPTLKIPLIWVPRPELDVASSSEVVTYGWIVFQELGPTNVNNPWHIYRLKKL